MKVRPIRPTPLQRLITALFLPFPATILIWEVKLRSRIWVAALLLLYCGFALVGMGISWMSPEMKLYGEVVMICSVLLMVLNSFVVSRIKGDIE